MSMPSDIQHDMLLLALKGELYTSPKLSAHATVLDVGTGTGTWACQVGERHPESRVYGIDLHRVNLMDIPANVVFETVDVMTGFPFNTGTFDLVHSRLLVGGITDWKSYLENLLRITKRGGHVECVELELKPLYHGSCATHENVDKWTDQMAGMLVKSQLQPNIARTLQERMVAAGFSEVKDTVIEVPVGEWPEMSKEREMGALAMAFSEHHMVQWLAQALIESGEPDEEVSAMRQRFQEELLNHDLQAYFRWHFVTGMKSNA